LNNGVSLKSGLRIKVTENATIRLIAYEFLLAFHSNCGSILHRIRQ